MNENRNENVSVYNLKALLMASEDENVKGKKFDDLTDEEKKDKPTIYSFLISNHSKLEKPILSLLSDELRNDDVVVGIAINDDIRNYEYIGNTLKNNYDYLISLLINHPQFDLLYSKIRKEQNYNDFAAYVLSQNPTLYFIFGAIEKNLNMMSTALDNITLDDKYMLFEGKDAYLGKSKQTGIINDNIENKFYSLQSKALFLSFCLGLLSGRGAKSIELKTKLNSIKLSEIDEDFISAVKKEIESTERPEKEKDIIYNLCGMVTPALLIDELSKKYSQSVQSLGHLRSYLIRSLRSTYKGKKIITIIEEQMNKISNNEKKYVDEESKLSNDLGSIGSM
ncbi:MAG: hypothetical protein ACI4U0_06315 [Candidatus Aphodocola sp.]